MSPSGTRSSLLHGRSRLEIAIVINQLATPGLGSWIAGRKIVGAGQLVLAVAGFLMFVAYFVQLMAGVVQALRTGEALAWPPAARWQVSLLTFALAWLWAGITSWGIYRELRRLPVTPTTRPPVLDPP